MQALQQLVDRLMTLFAVGLGFPEDFFAEVQEALCSFWNSHNAWHAFYG